MNVRLVLVDGTVVITELESLASAPNVVLVGKDERGVDTVVNWQHVVRAYSIEESPVVLPADAAV